MQLLALLEQTLNGLQFGIMLFLMAAGLTLIFGIMNLINLAQGSLYMIGAYVSATVFEASHSFLLAVAAALSAALIVGVAIELVVFRALYRRDHLDQVLATFGLVLFFNEMVRIIWGATALDSEVPTFLAGQVQILPGTFYPTIRLAIIVVGLLVALLLYLVVAKTRLGMLIRAGASNRVMVAALGINIALLYTLVFGLGAILAALAGVMAGPIFSVESGMGESVLILAFVVIVIGGIGSIRGAFIAALLIGLVDTMGRVFLRPVLALFMAPAAADNAGPALASMMIYIFMAAVLFFRPQGLFPTPHAMRPAVSAKAAVVIAGLALLALVPPIALALGEPFYLDLVSRIMIFAIAAVSLDLILGYGAMVSFGHAAYLGIGSYAVGILAHYGIADGVLQFATAILASAVAALFIGLVSLRTSGVYFIMITLAFGQMIYFLGVGLNAYGGDDGMNIAAHSDFGALLDLDNRTILYYFIFAMLALFLWIGFHLVESRFGMVIRGARSNERRMAAIGFRAFRYRLAAFVIAGAMCGVAGALLANLTLFVSPSIMHWTRSGEIMVMVILGGTGTLFGGVLGSIAYLLLENTLSGLTDHWQAVLGPILVLVVLFAKGGIFGLVPERMKRDASAAAKPDG